jgi:hypothetical protein
MTLSDVVAAMKAAGLSNDQIVATVEQLDEGRRARSREGNAARQRTFRERNAANALQAVTPPSTDNGNNARNARHALHPSPDKERSHTPPKEINPTPFVRDARAREAFERFWTAWPNKTQKTYAERCFAKVASDVEQILDGVSRYIRDKPPDRPWLNPSTFLNQHRWLDQPATIQPTGVKHGKGNLVDAGRDLLRRFDERERQMRAESGNPGGDQTVRLLPGFGSQRS